VSGREGEHPCGDAGQLVLLGLFLAVWIGDSFVWRLTTFLAGRLPLALRLAVLAVALGAAILLVRSGHRAAGHGGPSEGLVSDGAFRYVRHPLYLGSVLFYAGLVASTASLAALALTALIFAFYDRIATYEEGWLETRHGEAYRAYRSRTGKWWPGRRGVRVPGGGSS
jgi:protein-S-isoprenylcysteine O-methyltransferase Ste14